jgi:hypothetical protein
MYGSNVQVRLFLSVDTVCSKRAFLSVFVCVFVCVFVLGRNTVWGRLVTFWDFVLLALALLSRPFFECVLPRTHKESYHTTESCRISA